MTRKIRVGTIGTSGWADFMYLSSLRSHPQAELAAICGRNRARAGELAAKYNIPQVYTDYAAMMAQAGLDAVIVGAPDDLHYEMVMQAVRAGLHVLCDKPLTSTAQQAREMYAAAEQAGGKHMVLFTFRWMPFFRYVRDLIDQGVIGRCYMQQQVKLFGKGGSLELDVQYQGAEVGAVLHVACDREDQFQRVEVPASYWGGVSRTEPFGVFAQQPVGCRAFIDAILESRPVTPTFYDGYKAQQVIDAALEADKSGKWVSIHDPA